MLITPPREKYYYLACPHAHHDSNVREWRYRSAVQCQANLILAGMSIFNPIVMSHEVDKFAEGKITHDMWLRFDYPFLYHSAGIIVLQLAGWETSTGINWELGVATELDLPIIFIPGDEYMRHWPNELLHSVIGDDMMNTENQKGTA